MRPHHQVTAVIGTAHHQQRGSDYVLLRRKLPHVVRVFLETMVCLYGLISGKIAVEIAEYVFCHDVL